MKKNQKQPQALPRRSKKLRYFSYAVVAVIVLGIGLVLFWDKLPYQSAASSQIIKFLETQGIKVNSLKVNNLGTDAAEISDIDLGEDKHLLLKKMSVSYQFKKLYDEKKVESVELENLELNLYKKDTKFLLGALEKIMENAAPSTEPTKLDFQSMLALAPAKFAIKNSQINIELGKNNIQIPFDLSFTKANKPEILLNSKEINMVFEGKNLNAKDLKITAQYDEAKQKFNGTISAEKVKFTSDDEEFPEIPELKMLIDFSLSSDKLLADINMYCKDNKWKLLASLDMSIAEPAKALAQIKLLRFPYAQGVVTATVAKLPINMSKVVIAKVDLKNISLDELMDKVSEGRITGTGNINGTVPLKYYPDGRIEFGSGELKTNEAGIISVQPEMLPGDNEQMQIARTALENFNYTILKIGVSSNEGKLQLSMSLQGNNPEAFSGKQIKLNVNLSGDVLPLVQQSLLPINDIKQLLKESE